MTLVKGSEELSMYFAGQGGVMIRPVGWDEDCLFCALIAGYAFVYFDNWLEIYAPDEFEIVSEN